MIRPEPCFRCGARGSCKHREVDDVPLPRLGRKPSTADFDSRQFNGRSQKAPNSPRGKKGNPRRSQFQKIIDSLKPIP